MSLQVSISSEDHAHVRELEKKSWSWNPLEWLKKPSSSPPEKVEEYMESSPRNSLVKRVSFTSDLIERRDSGADSMASMKVHRHRRSSSSNSGHQRSFRSMPLEWYNFHLHGAMVGFDLELWWRRSIFATRLNIIMVVLLFFIAVMQLVAGIYFIVTHFITTPGSKTVKSPYVCKSLECQKATKWMIASMNQSVDPCGNFYEFMCGNYKDSDAELDRFEDLIHEPAFRIEFDEDSYLAKILRNTSNNRYHSHIEYYQACLNESNRKSAGLGALKQTLKYVLKTLNLTEFETPIVENVTDIEMEDIAVRLIDTMGHAVYYNLAFSAYPFMQVILPIWWMSHLHTSNPSHRLFISQIMNNLGTELFDLSPDSPIIDDMVEGILIFIHIVHTVTIDLKHMPIVTTNDSNKLSAAVKTRLAGICPPMGIQMKEFARPIFRKFFKSPDVGGRGFVQGVSQKIKRWFNGARFCFTENPLRFTKTIKYPKTAYVAIWIFGLFVEFLPQMDRNLLKEWAVDRNNGIVKKLDFEFSRKLESQCLGSMWRTLAYLPSTRYLLSTQDDPAFYLRQREEEIKRLFERTRKKWFRLPDTVSGDIKLLGNALLKRGLATNVMMPLIWGIVDDSEEKLGFTRDNHLRNALEATAYTILKLRQIWVGFTDPTAAMKFFGHGGPGSIRDRLLTMEAPMYEGALFAELKGSARKGVFVLTDFKRQPNNYILFPLSLYNQPNTYHTMGLKHGAITVKAIRSFLSLLSEALNVEFGKYEHAPGKPAGIDIIINWNYSVVQPKETCKTIDTTKFDVTQLYKLIPTDSVFFSGKANSEILFSTLATKFAAKEYQEELKKLKNMRYDWSLIPEQRKYRVHRYLPGSLTKYTEDQLFFMSFVRHVCRGSWKKYSDDRDRRYLLEVTVLNILMTMEEFSKVWNCPKNSFMNLDKDRCLKWIP